MNVHWDYGSFGKSRGGEKLSQVISPDPWFYQREEFYDEKVFLPHVGKALKDLPVPGRCEIFGVHYIFKKSFHVIYRLKGKNGKGDLVLLVQFHPPGESSKGYQEAVASAVNKGRVVHLSDWDAVAWIFPEDPELPCLPAMIDRSFILRRMGRHVDLPFHPDQIGWDLMSYLPWKRCSIHYRLPLPERDFVGKMHASVMETHRNMMRLWKSPLRRFRMPRPIGVDEDLGVRWEAFVEGRRIEGLFSEISFNSLTEKVVYDLASLHQIPLENLAPNGSEEVIHRIERKIMPRIREMLPSLGAAADAFYKTLVQKARSLPDLPGVTLHGDFHAANLLVDLEGPIFVDMDSIALGDPAYDLSLFGSRLLLIALQRGERIGAVADVVANLGEIYESVSGRAIPKRTFAWYMAALLVGRQIKVCMGHRAPSLERLAPALLACAREMLEREQFDTSMVGN